MDGRAMFKLAGIPMEYSFLIKKLSGFISFKEKRIEDGCVR